MIRCWIVNGFYVGKHPLVEKGWACVDVINPRVESACFDGWWSTIFFPTINHSVVFSNLKLVIDQVDICCKERMLAFKSVPP